MSRCTWVNLNNPLYIAYHDEEWGKPLHDEQSV
jgi:DNA-3-methyladenine glycosylase I